MLPRLSKIKLRFSFGIIMIAVIATAGATLGPRLAAADTRSHAPAALKTCNSSQPCSAFENKGSGAAIAGTADNNSGLVGTTLSNSLSGVKYGPFTIGSNAGVAAYDLATSFPDFNQAVLAISKHGTGLTAITESAEPNDMLGQVGVAGIDLNTQTLNNIGVYGYSGLDVGVFGSGHSIYGIGVFGSARDGGVAVLGNGRTASGIGVFGNQRDGGIGIIGNAALSSGIGILGNARDGVGIIGNSANSVGMIAQGSGATSEALRVVNSSSGPLMRGYNGSVEVMSLDNAGNFTVTGAVTAFGSPNLVTRDSSGGAKVMYAAKQSVATVEDVGEAQLVNGEAHVTIDAAFASTMDPNQRYLVFITPQGDTDGLYVTSKTRSGFVVREHDGRSNLAFDYRIVAKPYGSREQRLPEWSAIARPAPRGDVMSRIDMKRLNREIREPRILGQQ
jgi:hypothetical protein